MAGSLNSGCLECAVPNSSSQQVTFSTTAELESVHDVTIDKIAAKLLKENFILTALELHTELLESGKELPRLRDYFSNPGNFEKHAHTAADVSPVLPRTSSVQTFDSLDFARYSDDGEKQFDERVAVLEFELRKARETIKNLRANLTIVTESEPNTPDEGTENIAVSDDPVRPHERRALNFLVNEYLLKNNYKLTSITFSDENEDQDFEDWDDVGLNIPKPPDLPHLYRNYSRHMHLWNELTDAQVQTDNSCDLESEQIISSLEARNIELQNLILELQSQRLQRLSQENVTEVLPKTIGNVASKEELPSEMILESSSGEIELEVTMKQLVTTETLVQTCPVEGQGDSLDQSVENSKITLDKSLTWGEQPAPDTTKDISRLNKMLHVSSSFLSALTAVSLPQRQIPNKRLTADVINVVRNGEDVVLLLARCLPHIVPNVLLAKREELVPLLLAAVALHPEAEARDSLLHLLFNLTKRPDGDQRQVILTGLLTIAHSLGHSRVESELLPQCWEQISHKCMERRLLVAESCGHLASCVAAEMCSSLLLSMLQQMLTDEREEAVRNAATRSLSVLLAYVEDQDKFTQAIQLSLRIIQDDSDSVSEAGLSVLLPSVASWALHLGKLQTDFLPTLMQLVEEVVVTQPRHLFDSVYSGTPAEEGRFLKLIRALEVMVPFLFIDVLLSGPYVAHLSSVKGTPLGQLKVNRQVLPQNRLLNPVVIVGDEAKVAHLVQAFDEHIDKEWYRTWPVFDWVLTKFIPFLTSITIQLELHNGRSVHAASQLLLCFCQHFGWNFTNTKIKPAFVALIPMLHEAVSGDTSTVANETLEKATVPVYVCGVLTAFCHESDRQELRTALHDLLCTTASCHASLACLQCIILELCSNFSYQEVLLSILWDGVVDSSPAVRANTARLLELLVGVVGEAPLKNRVAPALVTLASDPELLVRIGTVRALGAILASSTEKELLDKAHMQLQTFLSDPVHQDDYYMQAEMIQMFAAVGPNTEQRFRDEFIIPKLFALAAENSQNPDEDKKSEITALLVDAYSALSCTFIPEQLILEVFLPGLRCVYEDTCQHCPAHEAAVASIIQEFESKLNFSCERAPSLTSPIASMEEMRRKVTKIFTAPPTNTRANLPNIFQLRKK
ncbi:RAB11-binding protein RELCH homolog [Ornithodoros turicata]|uniref:RAB11-binding protein RELCH homolog n=1 Tax=Ornithodoros turicata TaxID=34597 RepID=UPI003138B4C7